jgi:hypothetical protein
VPYPSMSTTDARRFMLSLREGNPISAEPLTSTKSLGPELDVERLVSDIRAVLSQLRRQFSNAKGVLSDSKRFEALASCDVHRVSPSSHPALGP